MAWVSSCVAPRRRRSVRTSVSESSGRASAFVVASFMVAYSSASWACGWSCNNPGYAAFFKLSSTTFDHSSPTAKDQAEYPPAKFVYLVQSSALYGVPIRLWNRLGIRVNSYGTPITEAQFGAIQAIAAPVTRYRLNAKGEVVSS